MLAGRVAIADGRFLSVGRSRDVEATAGATTNVATYNVRRSSRGFIDSHSTSSQRLRYNAGAAMGWRALRYRHPACSRRKWIATPSPQVGARRRRIHRTSFVGEPAPNDRRAECHRPYTPVSSALYGSRAAEWRGASCGGNNKATPNPPAVSRRDRNGIRLCLLLAQPNAGPFYNAPLAKGRISGEYQKNSSRQFMREVSARCDRRHRAGG